MPIHSIGGFMFIKGERGVGNSLETHYWLEKDDMLVDITADQFQDMKEEIVITETSSTWHGNFERFVLQEADHRMVAASDVRKHLAAVYDYVLEVGKLKTLTRR